MNDKDDDSCRFHIVPILLHIGVLRRVLSSLPDDTDSSSDLLGPMCDIEMIFSKFSKSQEEKRHLNEVILEELDKENPLAEDTRGAE